MQEKIIKIFIGIIIGLSMVILLMQILKNHLMKKQ